MNSLGRRKVYALALVAALVAGITPGIAAEGAETVQEVVANFTGTPIIKTDSDFYHSTKYPAIVNANGTLSVTIDNLQKNDIVQIMGESYPIMAKRYKGKDTTSTITWSPNEKHSGIYNIQVIRQKNNSQADVDEDELEDEIETYGMQKEWRDLVLINQIRPNRLVKTSRKIYVNPSNRNNLMQLGDLKVNTINWGKPFNQLDNSELMAMEMTTSSAYELEPEITTPSAYKLPNRPWYWSQVQITANLKSKTNGIQTQTNFTISEPGMWSRQINNWGGYDNTITEYKNFIARSGYYNVLAEVKGLNSIEAEDYKTTSFNKEYVTVKAGDKHHSEWAQVHKITLKEVSTKAGYLTVVATCDQNCSADSFEYAFLKEDDLGLTKLYGKGYQSFKDTENCNTVEIPNLNWNYKLVARAKHKEKGNIYSSEEEKTFLEVLPASYEAQIVKPIQGLVASSLINDVEVVRSVNANKKPLDNGGNEALQNKQTISIGGSAPAIAGEKNYITINPGNQDSNLQYKAWAIDDGVIIPLGEYSSSNEFVYYPKSGVGGGETHKLVVSVRKLDSNGKPSAKQTAEFTLNIE